VLPIDYGPPADPHDLAAAPLVESVWIEPFPDSMLTDAAAPPEARYEQREAVELAFIAAVQHLPARQRAVLLLRDVLGFSARETAEALETTSVSVDSALQRAHKSVETRLPEHSQQTTLRALGDDDLKQVVESFVAAWERADVDAIVSMLAEDAIVAMPPEPTWFSGRDAISTFLAAAPFAPTSPRHRLVPTWANGQIAFGHYSWRDEPKVFIRHAITVLSLRGAQIDGVAIFRGAGAFTGFELPDHLER
jgi:RNA polymerase sigma-70 factor (ECF subfamily)